jgi:hypothetical protein
MKYNVRAALLSVIVLAGSSALLFAQTENSNNEDSNKETLVTFSSPVEAPGMLLPAGAYIFKLIGNGADHVVIQVFDAGEGAPLAEFNTIPTSRAEATEESVVTKTSPSQRRNRRRGSRRTGRSTSS